MSTELENAFNTLKKAMKADPDYAYGWHANIAVMCADAIHDHKSECATYEMAHQMGNEGASRFMKLCFGVETSEDMLNT